MIEAPEIKKMNLTASYQVIMQNDLVKAAPVNAMSLNALKLLRTTIMNVVKEDSDFRTYHVTVQEFAKLLDISKSNLYREMNSITDELMDARITLKHNNGTTEKFHWVDYCKYDAGHLTIRLHEELKPYLLGLSQLYTQYVLSDILKMKTPTSIRMYELITEGMKQGKPYNGKPAYVKLSVAAIKEATNTTDKYQQFGMFKKRIIDKAIEEINAYTSYFVRYTIDKPSRQIVGFCFEVFDKLDAMKQGLYKPKDNENTSKKRGRPKTQSE